MSDLPLVLTVEEAARALRISRGSAYEAVRTGEIPSIRIGRRVLVPRQMLLTLLGVGDNAELPPKDGSHVPPHDPGGRTQLAQAVERERGSVKAGVTPNLRGPRA